MFIIVWITRFIGNIFYKYVHIYLMKETIIDAKILYLVMIFVCLIMVVILILEASKIIIDVNGWKDISFN